jgi:hypothetical protein
VVQLQEDLLHQFAITLVGARMAYSIEHDICLRPRSEDSLTVLVRYLIPAPVFAYGAQMHIALVVIEPSRKEGRRALGGEIPA